MSARVVVLTLLCLAGLVNAAYSQENPPSESEPAIRTEVQKVETPQDAEGRTDVSCHATCVAEGLDAEECRQECNWVVSVPAPRPTVCRR
jgi:hypothetical protein